MLKTKLVQIVHGFYMGMKWNIFKGNEKTIRKIELNHLISLFDI